MPAALYSKVRPISLQSLYLSGESLANYGSKLTIAQRDLLRRHSVLHETTYIRKVVSCDACRSNKTKCSGGTRCGLCKRRNIECVYRGNSRPSKLAPGTAATASVNGEIDQDQNNGPLDSGDDGDDDGNDTAATSKMSRPETSLNPDLLQRNVKFLQNLTVVPSQSGTSNFPLSSHSMGGLYELLLADKPSFEEALQDCEESKARVREYIDTYIKSFHLRWPVLHAPTLDNEIGTMPLSLAAAACLIGAWFQNSADWTERFYSLRMHEVLLERLLHSLVRHFYSLEVSVLTSLIDRARIDVRRESMAN